MSDVSERMRILQMIEDGKISAAEGLRLLEAFSGQGGGSDTGAAPAGPEPVSNPADARPDAGPERWQRWWMIPMGIGASIVSLAGALMYWAYRADGYGFWFFCSLMPFLFGVLVMALAAASRTARWLHVRVKTGRGDGPRNVAISLPVPIHLTAWALRVFGPFIPKLKDTGVDELILALGDNVSPQAPLYVEVDQGEGGEQVQVYLG